MSATMQRLGPLIFSSDGDVVCCEEMRIDSFLFCFECKSWGADSSIGQKSSCEEYAPHTTKCILGGVFFTISKKIVLSLQENDLAVNCYMFTIVHIVVVVSDGHSSRL